MSSDKLVEIPKSSLIKLRNLFLQDWPKHILGHDLINNYVRWFEQDPKFNKAKIYSLNGDWSDGTFIIIDNYSLFAYTLNDDLSNLTRLIQLIPTDQHYMCSNFIGKHLPAFEEAFSTLPFDLTLQQTNIRYYLPREKALKLELVVPDDVIIKELSASNIPQIVALYAYEAEDPPELFSKFIKYNPNFGAFDKATGTLMGWVTRYQCGTIATLRVEDKYKRRGLGELLVRAQARKIAEMGDDCNASVTIGKIPSQNLFTKLGFIRTGVETKWLEYHPRAHLKN